MRRHGPQQKKAAPAVRLERPGRRVRLIGGVGIIKRVGGYSLATGRSCPDRAARSARFTAASRSCASSDRSWPEGGEGGEAQAGEVAAGCLRGCTMRVARLRAMDVQTALFLVLGAPFNDVPVKRLFGDDFKRMPPNHREGQLRSSICRARFPKTQDHSAWAVLRRPAANRRRYRLARSRCGRSS